MQIQDVTRSQALQRARNYRGAKAGFQVSVYWAVQQTLNGNADGLYMIMLHAGMLAGKGDMMTTCADGRQLWKYWNAPVEEGGLGLKGIVTWDRDKVKFKMKDSWRLAAEKLDVAKLHVALADTRWDTFAKMKASRAFDLDKAVLRLLTQASNNGVTREELIEKIQAA